MGMFRPPISSARPTRGPQTPPLLVCPPASKTRRTVLAAGFPPALPDGGQERAWSGEVTRRMVLAAPPALVLGADGARAMAETGWGDLTQAKGINVAVTGASSGIGLEGARALYQNGANVIVLNRSEQRVKDSLDAIATTPSANGGTVTGCVCDLASLKSVNAAADALAEAPLDALCLNAGVQYTGEEEPRITEDGYEQTLQTNHIAHVLLAERLLPTLARSRNKRLAAGVDVPSRIVVTASEVHDPASPGGAVGPGADLGELAGLTRADGPGAGMADGGAFDADKMYKDTKLCNILFAYELTRRLAAARIAPSDVTVNAFGPGLITKSGFFRYQNPLFVGLFDFAASNIFRVTESVEGGGLLLANMAANPEYYAGSGGYWNNELAGFGGHTFTAIPTSTESYDTAKAARLYDVTARLAGIDAAACVTAAAAALHPEEVEKEAVSLAL